jgi:hypothetical protein
VNDAIIALIPEDAAGDEHLSLVYVDAESAEQCQWELYDLTAAMARLTPPFFADVVEHADFGTDSDEKVAVLLCPEAEHLRYLVAQYSASQWGFRPHVSLVQSRPVGSRIRFNRIGTWIGDEHTNWRLGAGTRCA